MRVVSGVADAFVDYTIIDDDDDDESDDDKVHRCGRSRVLWP